MHLQYRHWEMHFFIYIIKEMLGGDMENYIEERRRKYRYEHEEELKKIPLEFHKDQIAEDNRVIIHDYKVYQAVEIHEFVESVLHGKCDKVKITIFVEGKAPSFSILECTGSEIMYTIKGENKEEEYFTRYGGSIKEEKKVVENIAYIDYYLITHDSKEVYLITIPSLNEVS